MVVNDVRVRRSVTATLAEDVILRLDAEAERLKLSRAGLVKLLLTACARDGLTDAVLDIEGAREAAE